MAQEFPHGGLVRSNAHITTSTTTTPVSTDAILYSINIGVTTAGTTWVLTIKDKGSTPKVAYINTGTGVAIGQTSIAFPFGIRMDGGIDIVTAGTAGVLDVFLVYSI